MKNEAGRQKSFSAMGASSILMIFVVLCLTTFGILSMMTSHSDLKLSKKAHAAVENYYDADAKVKEVIAIFDEEMVNFKKRNVPQAEYINKIVDKIKVDLKQWEYDTKIIFINNIISITAPIEGIKNQVLKADLKIFDVSESKRFEIISYKKINIIDYEGLSDENNN